MEGQNFYHETKDPTRWEAVKSLAKSAGKATIDFIGDTIQKCAVAEDCGDHQCRNKR